MNICSFFFGLTLVILFSGIHSATLTVKNNCPYTIWPATQTGGGAAQLSNTGFELVSQNSATLDTPASWSSGKLWARTQCSSDSSGRFTCATADCGSGQVECNGAGEVPPASLAEFTLGSADGTDTYDISLVNGFNLPVSITPQGGSGQNCTTTNCGVDINAECPSDLAIKDSNGGIIGCKSACAAFNEPKYCCTGTYNSPDTCKATNYSMFFKNKCPQAYSFAYDDHSSTFSCTGGPNYLITFCP
ncbi:hypothetical protein SLEP1_g48468 [Rubroshorea leprosula]|uniref:Thaumatin-like protein n=1 Tax=Rubroshorea leprosula TaxID=152421 RepID=A0AAV5LTR0_9ROSI|nr:hypothetical protein SLEP1_g48468 [Rubroshorea leprosula]